MQILGLCGKLGSGKTTTANFLIRNAEEFFGPGVVVKKYALADSLKSFLVEYLDIEPEKLYGTQEEKNQPTHILWENLPHYSEIKHSISQEIIKESGYMDSDNWHSWRDEIAAAVKERLPSGPLTGREVMEQVGTEIFRRLYEDIWTLHCLKRIKKDSSTLAIIDDVRFPNEAKAIRKAGGKLVHLNRTTEESKRNTHKSNVSLDDYQGYDLFINNQFHNIGDTNKILIQNLYHWFLPNTNNKHVNVLGCYLPV